MHKEHYRDCDAWEFYADEHNRWHWTRIETEKGEIVGRSHRGFADKYECFANARRHGYGFPRWRDEPDEPDPEQ